MASFCCFPGFRDDKLVVDGKVYVYNEEQGRVVQHRVRGAVKEAGAGSKWTSLESLDLGSVGHNMVELLTGCCRMSPCQSRLDDHRMLESRLMELEKMVEANREAVTRNTREVSSDEISEDNE